MSLEDEFFEDIEEEVISVDEVNILLLKENAIVNITNEFKDLVDSKNLVLTLAERIAITKVLYKVLELIQQNNEEVIQYVAGTGIIHNVMYNIQIDSSISIDDIIDKILSERRVKRA